MTGSTLTILSALKSHVQYPLPEDFFKTILIKRELSADDNCTKQAIDSSAFKGAIADCIKQLVLYPNSVSQGGISISKADRQSLINYANELYRSVGEAIIDERPKITFY